MNNPIMQAVSQMMGMGANNPGAFVNEIMTRNPQFAALIRGQNPRQMAESMLRQRGIDPDQVARMMQAQRR